MRSLNIFISSMLFVQLNENLGMESKKKSPDWNIKCRRGKSPRDLKFAFIGRASASGLSWRERIIKFEQDIFILFYGHFNYTLFAVIYCAWILDNWRFESSKSKACFDGRRRLNTASLLKKRSKIR